MTDAATLGNRICASLRDKGLNPVFMEPVGDAIEVGFDLIDRRPTWTKSITCAAAGADPTAFVLLLNEWKAKVRKDIVLGSASPVVRQMIQAHGIVAVMNALKDT